MMYGVCPRPSSRAGGHSWFEHRRYRTLTGSAAPEEGEWDVFEFPHHLRLEQL